MTFDKCVAGVMAEDILKNFYLEMAKFDMTLAKDASTLQLVLKGVVFGLVFDFEVTYDIHSVWQSIKNIISKLTDVHKLKGQHPSM